MIRWLTLYTPKQCLVTSPLLCSFLIAGRFSPPELNYTASYREMKDHFVRRQFKVFYLATGESWLNNSIKKAHSPAFIRAKRLPFWFSLTLRNWDLCWVSPLSLPRYLIKIVPLKITMDSSYLFSCEKFSTLFIARGWPIALFALAESTLLDRIHSTNLCGKTTRALDRPG